MYRINVFLSVHPQSLQVHTTCDIWHILVICFVLFVVCIACLIYYIKVLEDELDDLYDTCYTYIERDFGLKDGGF